MFRRVISSTVWMRVATSERRPAHRMMKPPRMNVLATTSGVNKWALTMLPNSRPSTSASRKLMPPLERERDAWGWMGAPLRCRGSSVSTPG